MRAHRISRGKTEKRDADRSLRGIVADLEIPEPFSIEQFCDIIARKRGRPLHLHAIDHGTAEKIPCGVWIATDRGDHIFVEDATSPMHRSHIILHEICHMLLGHSLLPNQRDSDSAGVLGTSAFSSIRPETISSMLGRTSYTTKDEKDAEALAGLIADRIQARTDASGSDDQLVAHLLRALSEA